MSTSGRGIVKLVTARAASLGIGLAAAPIISRLYLPRHFGLAGLVQSISTFLIAFACLGYPRAIPLSGSRGEARALVRLCLVLTGLLLLPVVLVPLLAGGLVASWLGEEAIEPLLWVVPLVFLLAGLRQTAQYSCSRERRFGTLALQNFGVTNAGRLGLIAFGGLLGGSALYVLLSNALGIAVGLLFGASVAARLGFGREEVERWSLGAAARQHSQFPRVIVWSRALNAASRSVPVLLLGGLFTSAVVGYYTFGQRFLMLPMTILGTSVADVFYPQAASEWNATGRLEESFRKNVRVLSFFCIFPMVALCLLGPMMFATVFGSRWTEAGVYARLLAPAMVVVLLASPVSSVFSITRHAGLGLCYNVALLVGRAGSLLAGHWLGGPRTAVGCFALVSGLVFVHLMGSAMRLGGVARRPVACTVLREAALAGAFLLPAAAVEWLTGWSGAAWALLGAAGLGYYAWVYRRDPLVQVRVHSLLRRLRRVHSDAGGPNGE
ncbi:MAG: oligosaccharide flippase family protein [Candidatus Brocadiia bacterium]